MRTLYSPFLCYLFIASASGLFSCPFVAAQERCGGINGRTTSIEGWVIAGATIRLINKTNKQTVNVKTDENGEFRVCLQSGKYDVFADAPGYRIEKRGPIEVQAQGKNIVDLVMKHDKSAWVDREHP